MYTFFYQYYIFNYLNCYDSKQAIWIFSLLDKGTSIGARNLLLTVYTGTLQCQPSFWSKYGVQAVVIEGTTSVEALNNGRLCFISIDWLLQHFTENKYVVH